GAGRVALLATCCRHDTVPAARVAQAPPPGAARPAATAEPRARRAAVAQRTLHPLPARTLLRPGAGACVAGRGRFRPGVFQARGLGALASLLARRRSTAVGAPGGEGHAGHKAAGQAPRPRRHALLYPRIIHGTAVLLIGW